MAMTILFGVFTLLLLVGTPVAFCLGLASLATVLYLDLPPVVVFQQINSGMNAFSMLAIPFFIFAGDLMMRGGIADRLIGMAASLVGHLRGGLGQVNVVASRLTALIFRLPLLQTILLPLKSDSGSAGSVS
jgi:TRAP-type mannitol/chloroaromatic compound transport system permease large subunit